MQRLPPPATGLLGRIFATVIALVVGVGLFMFSIIVFAVLLAAGLGFGVYLWWKTRSLRHALRVQMAEIKRGAVDITEPVNPAATVIEAEYLRLDETGRELPREDK